MANDRFVVTERPAGVGHNQSLPAQVKCAPKRTSCVATTPVNAENFSADSVRAECDAASAAFADAQSTGRDTYRLGSLAPPKPSFAARFRTCACSISAVARHLELEDGSRILCFLLLDFERRQDVGGSRT